MHFTRNDIWSFPLVRQKKVSCLLTLLYCCESRSRTSWNRIVIKKITYNFSEVHFKRITVWLCHGCMALLPPLKSCQCMVLLAHLKSPPPTGSLSLRVFCMEGRWRSAQRLTLTPTATSLILKKEKRERLSNRCIISKAVYNKLCSAKAILRYIRTFIY